MIRAAILYAFIKRRLGGGLMSGWPASGVVNFVRL
jgi:hypothetical protein